MYIVSSGAFYNEVAQDELLDLKQLVTETCGRKFRRIDRFIQLALIGSHRCTDEQTLKHDTGLYLGSGEGPKSNIHKSLELVYKHKEPLMPLNFINMVSNASSFYIAQALDISGANIFASDQHFAFNRALKLAQLDMQSSICNMALVGCVDECSEPLDIQKRLLNAKADDKIAEGSYWLLLSDEKQQASAKITHNQHHASLADAITSLKSSALDNALLAVGEGIDAQDKIALADISHIELWEYQQDIAISRNHTGFALTTFLNDDSIKHSALVHISRDNFDNYNTIVIEKGI